MQNVHTCISISVKENVFVCFCLNFTLGEKSTGSTPLQSNTTIVLNLLESSAVYAFILSGMISEIEAKYKHCHIDINKTYPGPIVYCCCPFWGDLSTQNIILCFYCFNDNLSLRHIIFHTSMFSYKCASIILQTAKVKYLLTSVLGITY